MRIKKSALLILLLLVILLIDPTRYFDSVAKGVALFSASVLPSMLPYFFFTKIFTSVGGAEGISKSIGKPISKLYKVSPLCGYAFVMSILSGYPVGARVLADLYEKGLIDEKDAARACSFASTSGSMFVLGSVGGAILGNVKAGWIILICHYIGALLNGLIFCLGKRKAPVATPLALLGEEKENLLSDAMYESVLSLALVGGFIAIANLAADMAADVFAFFGTDIMSRSNVLSGVLYSFFEVMRGCVAFSECAVSLPLIVALSAGAISFGGLSVQFQTMAFLGKSGLRAGKLLLMKFSQALITFVLCFGVGSLFL